MKKIKIMLLSHRNIKPPNFIVILYIFILLLIIPGVKWAEASNISDGQKYFLKNDYKNAIKKFEIALKDGKETPILWYLIGKSYMALDDFKNSKHAFNKAIKLKADYALARLNLARLCYEKKDWECASLNYEYIKNNIAGELTKIDQGNIGNLHKLDFGKIVQKDYQETNSKKTEDPSGLDTNPPKIVIYSPKFTRGILVVNQKGSVNSIHIKGKAIDTSGILSIKINGLLVEKTIKGKFEKILKIKSGKNLIRIAATDKRGNTAFKELILDSANILTANEKTDAAHVSSAKIEGRYFALIIAVEDYKDPNIMDLDHPVDDALRLESILKKQYTFDPKKILFLKNPTRSRIVNTFYGLSKTIKPTDNFFIFYAGHGFWDESMGIGYWLPNDAKQKDRSEWISNSTIRDYITGIKSRHTLLMADACFSGGIFKTRKAFKNVSTAIHELYSLNSRKAITSGTLSVVPDKSVFTDYFIKRLKDNNNKYISSHELYSKFRIAVINNSPTKQVPQYGTIHGAGDEGGDFIFTKRE